jgi:hypothetical protein
MYAARCTTVRLFVLGAVRNQLPLADLRVPNPELRIRA